ncbi:IS110 family RNA-guided transposase [Novosphingobium terrae]|uniref:IS110 family transposase n=1 Tax=Novosphingobium terrae TaxID=2726189 RepID=UPI00197DEA67|nr:IS110 family transposase [Novosphingobium terrae]
MADAYMLAIDLAKRSFQVCATDRTGSVLYNRAMSRAKLEALLTEHSHCIVAMEACATGHFWGRTAQAAGHEVRLIPPIYVKPFVKRQKNDASDAAAIAEAARRPDLHCVAVKSAEHQARAVAYRTHQCFVSQRTQTINALRGHLAEFGLIFAQGTPHLKDIQTAIQDEATNLPDSVRDVARLYLDHIDVLTAHIDQLLLKLREAMQVNAEMRRLCTVPGVGLVTAGAIMAFAPDLRTFANGRNFAAWLGLVPRQRSTGGKAKLGSMSKMGQSDIRKLLVVGAMSRIRWIVRKGVLPDNWLGRLMGRKPRMVAAVALANKMARIVWAIMTREENYKLA